MELSQKSIKRSFESFKELFDIVLNSEASIPRPQLYQPASSPQVLLGMAPSLSFGSSGGMAHRAR